MDRKICVRDFQSVTGRRDLQLELIAGEGGLDKEILIGDINRPGLTLAGFYDFFAFDRIQVFGLGETAFMKQMSDGDKKISYERFFSYSILCCIFTHNVKPDDIFIKFAEDNNVPVYTSGRTTTRFISLLVHIMDEVFAPSKTLHGTLVDIFGLGVLILGKSGVGKSECALELIERGHRLVADDVVEVKMVDDSFLIGSGSPLLKHHMEIRGMGIINVRDIFGIRSVRNRKRIELVVELEEWDDNKVYDRLGLDDSKYNLFDIDIPFLIVPVRPGRNIPVIIETAALNQRLKKLGVYSARELDKKIQQQVNR